MRGGKEREGKTWREEFTPTLWTCFPSRQMSIKTTNKVNKYIFLIWNFTMKCWPAGKSTLALVYTLHWIYPFLCVRVFVFWLAREPLASRSGPISRILLMSSFMKCYTAEHEKTAGKSEKEREHNTVDGDENANWRKKRKKIHRWSRKKRMKRESPRNRCTLPEYLNVAHR